MKRGEVWWCALDSTVGHEIQKTRPCLIVSPDDLNDRLPTYLVVPLTSGSHPTRFRVPVRFQGKDGLLLPEQMRSLDRRRFRKRLGMVDRIALSAVLGVLRDMFAE